MAELADYLGLDRSTVSGLIDRAADRGLVQRIPDKGDGRASRVKLTRAGHRLAARGRAQVAEPVGRLVQYLSVSERHTLSSLLQHILAA